MKFPDADPRNPGCAAVLLLLAVLLALAGCSVHGHPVPAPVAGVRAVAR